MVVRQLHVSCMMQELRFIYFFSSIQNVFIPVMTSLLAIEEAAAVCLLPLLLKEKGGNPKDFIKICRVSQILMILNLIISKAQLFMDGPSIFPTNCHLIVGNIFLISILKLTCGKKVLCSKTLDMNITYFCFCISNALPF